jgi:hypothetical protein
MEPKVGINSGNQRFRSGTLKANTFKHKVGVSNTEDLSLLKFRTSPFVQIKM